MAVKIQDPATGKVYHSIKALAKERGLNVSTVYQRLARGYSSEVALANQHLGHTPARDHTGACFPTTAAMCRHWGIPATCFWQRFHLRGWTLERSLTEPVAPSNAVGHHGSGSGGPHGRAVEIDGVKYASIREAAKARGVNVATVYQRLGRHEPIEAALRPSRGRFFVWYKGKCYFTKIQLARELGLPVGKVDALEGVTYESK
jgi:hypothetical protein